MAEEVLAAIETSACWFFVEAFAGQHSTGSCSSQPPQLVCCDGYLLLLQLLHLPSLPTGF